MCQIGILSIYGSQIPDKVGRVYYKISNRTGMLTDLGSFLRHKCAGNPLGGEIDGGCQVSSFQEDICLHVVFFKHVSDFVRQVLPGFCQDQRDMFQKLQSSKRIPFKSRTIRE